MSIPISRLIPSNPVIIMVYRTSRSSWGDDVGRGRLHITQADHHEGDATCKKEDADRNTY
jgi:hypothetical protein